MKTLSEEMDAWLEERTRKPAPAEPWKREEPRLTSPEWARSVELTEGQWAWVWEHFRSLSLPMLGFATRLRATAPKPPDMSPEQRRWVLALTYKYRRQIWGPKAAKLTEADFVRAIKARAK